MISSRASRELPTAASKRESSASVRRAGAWTVLDQGVVSAGNFLTFAILARLLEPEAFGCFALVLGALAVLNNVHGGLIIYPLLLKGAAAGEVELRSTCTQALVTTVFLLPMQLAVVAGACWYANIPAVWPMTALVAWQVQETLRRTFTAQMQQVKAVPGDVLGYLGRVAVIIAISRLFVLTLDGVFATMATTFAAAAALQAVQIRPAQIAAATVWRAVRDFLHEGRWALITHLSSMATPQVFLWAVAVHSGPKQAAAFQALSTVIGFLNPVMFSAGNLITPAAARSMAKADITEAIRTAIRYAVHGTVLVGPYLLLLLLAPGLVLSLIYGAESPYSQLHTGLRLFALYGCTVYVAHVMASLLNGIGRSNLVCKAHAISALVVVASIPVIVMGGLRAGILGLAMTAMVRLVLHAVDIISAGQQSARYRAAANAGG